jgi:ectoine hydroxylase-related dioxygenase (phytanoyl-CoA dioxygenase family)
METTVERSGTRRAALRRQWDEQSYVLVRRLLPADEAEEMRVICEHAMRQWYECEPHFGRSVGTDASAQMRHVHHPAYFRGHQDWLAKLLDLSADPRVLEIVRAVLPDDPLWGGTTFWFNPRAGSRNGGWHRDSQFLTNTEEEEKQRLFGGPEDQRTTVVQLQLALVASDDTEVVPGSHRRWDTPEEYHIRRADNFAHCQSDDMPDALRVALRPGDAVAFNAGALHRGRYHADKPRRTLMLSYARRSLPQGHDYFTNQPWLLEPGYFDGTRPETRAFVQHLIDKCGHNWDKGDRFEPV